jgi:hypothetical protein
MNPTTTIDPTLPKKRGRKRKVIPQNNPNTETVNITITLEENEQILQNNTEPQLPKKRGRKPKGGKLVTKKQDSINLNHSVANIVLHLKCSMQDLNDHNTNIKQMVSDPMIYNPTIPPSILTYNNDNSIFASFDNNNSIEKPIEKKDYAYAEFEPKNLSSVSNICHSCSMKICDELPINNEEDDDINIKDINSKLKRLKIQLYKNSNPDKKSACFWCTYEYDNPSCYIPKYENDDQIFGYGSFCRPECSVAYLMKENLDDSTKFERYHLLNQIYSKVYDYKKNIKPAPNPYFLLDKFYGNLTIQEYRKLLKTEHMLLVIDKPLTRILPELHEDNEDFIMNIYGGTTQPNQNISGVYKVKRESDRPKGPSKKSIMKDKFGLA